MLPTSTPLLRPHGAMLPTSTPLLRPHGAMLLTSAPVIRPSLRMELPHLSRAPNLPRTLRICKTRADRTCSILHRGRNHSRTRNRTPKITHRTQDRTPKKNQQSLRQNSRYSPQRGNPQNLNTIIDSQLDPDDISTSAQQLVENYPAEEYNPAAYIDEPARYDMQWSVNDNNGNDFGQRESRNEDVTRGEYHVRLPDSRKQRVTYSVQGGSGFLAQVEYVQDDSAGRNLLEAAGEDGRRGGGQQATRSVLAGSAYNRQVALNQLDDDTSSSSIGSSPGQGLQGNVFFQPESQQSRDAQYQPQQQSRDSWRQRQQARRQSTQTTSSRSVPTPSRSQTSPYQPPPSQQPDVQSIIPSTQSTYQPPQSSQTPQQDTSSPGQSPAPTQSQFGQQYSSIPQQQGSTEATYQPAPQTLQVQPTQQPSLAQSINQFQSSNSVSPTPQRPQPSSAGSTYQPPNNQSPPQDGWPSWQQQNPQQFSTQQNPQQLSTQQNPQQPTQTTWFNSQPSPQTTQASYQQPQTTQTTYRQPQPQPTRQTFQSPQPDQSSSTQFSSQTTYQPSSPSPTQQSFVQSTFQPPNQSNNQQSPGRSTIQQSNQSPTQQSFGQSTYQPPNPSQQSFGQSANPQFDQSPTQQSFGQSSDQSPNPSLTQQSTSQSVFQRPIQSSDSQSSSRPSYRTASQTSVQQSSNVQWSQPSQSQPADQQGYKSKRQSYRLPFFQQPAAQLGSSGSRQALQTPPSDVRVRTSSVQTPAQVDYGDWKPSSSYQQLSDGRWRLQNDTAADGSSATAAVPSTSGSSGGFLYRPAYSTQRPLTAGAQQNNPRDSSSGSSSGQQQRNPAGYGNPKPDTIFRAPANGSSVEYSVGSPDEYSTLKPGSIL